MKLLVWTEAYDPFIMGGDVNAPIATEVEVGEPIPIGAGYSAYLIASPVTGETFVAEATTGAFVGGTVAAVRADIAEADPAVMDKQIETARQRLKKVRILSPDQFWRKFSN